MGEFILNNPSCYLWLSITTQVLVATALLLGNVYLLLLIIKTTKSLKNN